MKILFVANKSLKRNGVEKLDASYYNFYIPLLELGHQVEFYDTIKPFEPNFKKVVERFKPELVFSILTGDSAITPFEPIKEIKLLTKEGNIKTFNWFCDDTWRYDTFSKNVCRFFSAVSTPEPEMIERYKQDGYSNVLLGNWHINNKLVNCTDKKTWDVGFVGGLNNQRINGLKTLQSLGVQIGNIQSASYEDLLLLYAASKIGINFSSNENDPKKQTQMKLRMFEVPAVGTTLLTENHKTLDQFFDISKEIMTFSSQEEMIEKTMFLLKNESVRNAIAKAGKERVEKQHTSHIRLQNMLEEIKKI